MKTKKIFGYGLTAVLFTLAFAAVPLAGCDNTASPSFTPSGGTGTSNNTGTNNTGTGEITVTAGNTLAAKLQWVKNNAKSNTVYTITVNSDEIITPRQVLNYAGKSAVTVALEGNGGEKVISLNSEGSLFIVESGVTLVLDRNITLKGRSNSTSLLIVRSEGALIMNAGAKITGNSNPHYGGSGDGGGVFVNGGTFTMNGGTISGNNADDYGGGVYVKGGTISGNTAAIDGGGLDLSNGTFTMNGGTISGNKATNGGGVFMWIGTFTMTGGTISGNTASNVGGGVGVNNTAIFNKTGGTIYGYSASDTTNSNVVKNSSNVVQNNKGHAVYASNNNVTKRRETAAGTGMNLSFNGSNGTFSGGWE